MAQRFKQWPEFGTSGCLRRRKESQTMLSQIEGVGPVAAQHSVVRCASKAPDIVITCHDNAAKDLTVGGMKSNGVALFFPRSSCRFLDQTAQVSRTCAAALWWR